MTATAEAAPYRPEDYITIEPDKAERGRKAIFVDGVRWGTINMQSAGAHGAYYWFLQEDYPGEICRQGERVWKGSNRTTSHPVKVWGDKTARRNAELAARGTPDARTAADNLPSLEARLMTETKALIVEGLLRHPDKVKEEQQRQRAEYRQREAEGEKRENDEFAAKAADCLAALGDQIGDNSKAEVVAQIVAAMRWAQTK